MLSLKYNIQGANVENCALIISIPGFWSANVCQFISSSFNISFLFKFSLILRNYLAEFKIQIFTVDQTNAFQRCGKNYEDIYRYKDSNISKQ